MYRCRSLREMQCKCATPVHGAEFQPWGWGGAAESGLQKAPQWSTELLLEPVENESLYHLFALVRG